MNTLLMEPWPRADAFSYFYKRDGDTAYRWGRTPDGDFPGVTTVLKMNGGRTEGLIKWAANSERAMLLEAVSRAWNNGAKTAAEFVHSVEKECGEARSHQRILEKASDVGGKIHEAIKCRIHNALGMRVKEPVLADERVVWGFDIWQNWWADCKYRPIVVEQPIWSTHLRTCGTLDFLVECPERGPGIVDFKSSKGVYDDHHMQVAMYSRMVRDRWHPVRWAEIIKLPKDLESMEFQVHSLGHLRRWNGKTKQPYVVEKSESQLVHAFMGLHQAFIELTAEAV